MEDVKINLAGVELTRLKRPEMLIGSTYIIRNIPTTSNSVVDVRLTINESQGMIFEMFAESSDPAMFEWLTAINRIASMAMQYGIPVGAIIDCFENIHSTITNHAVPGIGMCQSLPARIGQILRTHYLKE